MESYFTEGNHKLSIEQQQQQQKIFKFHGSEVENIIIRYTVKQYDKPDTAVIEEFDALKDAEPCETINVQIVADFVTMTFYGNENENSIIRRELIPSHAIEHIWVKDFAGTKTSINCCE